MSGIDQEKAISRVLRAIEAIRAGRMVIMVDDEDRENEGDLVFAAQHVSAEKINFMVKEARGLVCLTLEPNLVDRLRLPLMADVTKSGASRSTAFTVSIEAKTGVTTGISAADRAETVRVAIDDRTSPDDIVVPGHVFPLRAKTGGVLERAGHTEGSVDLARLAGLKPAAVICEIMKDDGTMARMPDLAAFAERHDLEVVTIADLITFRLLKESLVDVLAQHPVRTEAGVFDGYLFKSLVDGTKHLALVKGHDLANHVVDVRVHSQRALLDVFGAKEGGRERVDYGLQMLNQTEHGVFLYISHEHPEARFAMEFAELSANPRDVEEAKTLNQPPMDLRLYGTGAQILRHLGVKQMRLHMSAARPLRGLAGFGLEVVDTRVLGSEA